MIKLLCPECQRENEAERIYCHECGGRLDRSALAKEKSKEEDPIATQRRLRSMLDPQRAKLRQRFFLFARIFLAAVFAAVIVQMLRPPDLPPKAKSPMLPAQINLDLENLAMDPRLGPLRYSEDQLNAYLGYSLRTKQAALSKYYLQFERVVVDLESGYCDVAVERSLFGFPVVTTGSYAAAIQNGNVTATNRGGYLGRMPIHPALMKAASFLFADVRAALERERKSLTKLGSIEFQPQMVIIAPKQVPQT